MRFIPIMAFCIYREGQAPIEQTQNTTNNMKKTTLATIKSFIRKNKDNLFIQVESSFCGMSDMVEQNDNATFHAVDGAAVDFDDKHTLGITGFWLVNQSRDSFTPFDDGEFVGYVVYNACGSTVIAVKNPAFVPVDAPSVPQDKKATDASDDIPQPTGDNTAFPEVTGVTIHWAESNLVDPETKFQTLEQANHLLYKIAKDHPRGGGYCKVKFTVHFGTDKDGDAQDWIGRFDVHGYGDKQETFSGNLCLIDHINDYLQFHLGNQKPDHMSARDYYNFLHNQNATNCDMVDLCNQWDAIVNPKPNNIIQFPKAG